MYKFLLAVVAITGSFTLTALNASAALSSSSANMHAGYGMMTNIDYGWHHRHWHHRHWHHGHWHYWN